MSNTRQEPIAPTKRGQGPSLMIAAAYGARDAITKIVPEVVLEFMARFTPIDYEELISDNNGGFELGTARDEDGAKIFFAAFSPSLGLVLGYPKTRRAVAVSLADLYEIPRTLGYASEEESESSSAKANETARRILGACKRYPTPVSRVNDKIVVDALFEDPKRYDTDYGASTEQ